MKCAADVLQIEVLDANEAMSDQVDASLDDGSASRAELFVGEVE